MYIETKYVAWLSHRCTFSSFHHLTISSFSLFIVSFNRRMLRFTLASLIPFTPTTQRSTIIVLFIFVAFTIAHSVVVGTPGIVHRLSPHCPWNKNFTFVSFASTNWQPLICVRGQQTNIVRCSHSHQYNEQRHVSCGQAYVALSRVTNLHGVHLINVDLKSIKAQASATTEYNRLRRKYRADLSEIKPSKPFKRINNEREWAIRKTVATVQESEPEKKKGKICNNKKTTPKKKKTVSNKKI